MGGILSDVLYRYTKSLWSKKILLHCFGLLMGALLIIIGLVKETESLPTIVGLLTVLAFFEEAGNGAVWTLALF